MPRQTLDDIRAIPKEMLTAKDIAGYLGCDPHSIRVQARADLKALGYPASVEGTRVKIPKEGFLRWAEGLLEEKRTARRSSRIRRRTEKRKRSV